MRQHTGIRCYFLRANQYVSIQRAPEGQRITHFNQGTYVIDARAVNISADLDTRAMNPRPELVFIEGDPQAITARPLNKTDKELSYLDKIILENKMRQATGIKRGPKLGQYFVMALKSPGSFLILVIGIILLLSFMSGEGFI